MSETPEPESTPKHEAPPAAESESSPPGADQAKEVYSAVMADQNLKIGAGGFIVFFIGLLFNWVSVSVGGLSATQSGFGLDRGKAIFVLAIVALVMLYLRSSLVALITGGLAAAWTLYTVFDIGIGDTGLGIWVSLIGVAALAYAAFTQNSQASS
jgi:hypothetical protein